MTKRDILTILNKEENTNISRHALVDALRYIIDRLPEEQPQQKEARIPNAGTQSDPRIAHNIYLAAEEYCGKQWTPEKNKYILQRFRDYFAEQPKEQWIPVSEEIEEYLLANTLLNPREIEKLLIFLKPLLINNENYK